jgi:hypothetical protein
MSLNEIYNETSIGKRSSDMPLIQNGMKQGDVLTPLLLNFALGRSNTGRHWNITGHIIFWSMPVILILMGENIEAPKEKHRNCLDASRRLG